jgi:chromosome segregation ATPase
MKAQNQTGTLNRMNALEDKLRDYEKFIMELQNDRDNMREILNEHEQAINDLQSNSNPIGPSKDTISDKLKELEYEIKLIVERIRDLQFKINDLSKEHGQLGEDDDSKAKIVEDTRKKLEGEVNSMKGRVSQLEDRLKMLIMKLQDQLKQEGYELNNQSIDSDNADKGNKTHPDLDKTKNMTFEIEKLRDRIRELEETLRKLKRHRNTQASVADGVDYMIFIEELREDLDREVNNFTERIDKCEDNQGKTDFRSLNNEKRIDDLENLVSSFNDKIANSVRDCKNNKISLEELEKKIKELESGMNDKVDSEDFDREITCKLLTLPK